MDIWQELLVKLVVASIYDRLREMSRALETQ